MESIERLYALRSEPWRRLEPHRIHREADTYLLAGLADGFPL